MVTHGLRAILVLAPVLGLATGCRGVPPGSPAHTPPETAEQQDDDSGWLFDRLTGRTSSASRHDRPSGVQQASAVEPIEPSEPATGGGRSSPSNRASFSPQSATEEDAGFQLSDLAPDKVWENIKNTAGYGPNEGVARALLEEGKTLYEQEKYVEAAGRFKAAAERWPDSPLEEDALFLLGESQFFSDQYPKANDTYGTLLKKHENSRYLDKIVARQFAIGRYWEQKHAQSSRWPIVPNLTDREEPLFDTWGNALKAYESVRLNDPTGPLADDSIMATANANFRKGRYEESAYHYELLRKEYGKSDLQLPAHLLAMKSKQELYQGPLYDGTPLKDAGELAEQTLTQFPRRLGDERDRLVQTKNGIDNEKARRDWTIAQYYDKKEYFGAARYYYRIVIEDHPRTRYAQMAEDRLEQIKDQPNNPPQRFKWLTDLFLSDG